MRRFILAAVALAAVAAIFLLATLPPNPTETPLTGVDPALVRRTVAGLSQQVIMSTHDLELVLDMDRVLVVESGKIAYDGGAAAAVEHYRSLSVRSLSGGDFL